MLVRLYGAGVGDAGGGAGEVRRGRVSGSGGGLGVREAALMADWRGCEVDLYEVRSVVDVVLRSTPAHQTADFAELVCSNSLKSESENTAPWLLKEELRRAGSLLLRIARECAVPPRHALAGERTTLAAQGNAAPSSERPSTAQR